MKIIITGRKIEVTEALKNVINKKIGRLSKFFDDNAEAQVTLSVEKGRQIIETTIHHGGMIYRAEESNSDMYAAIDKVGDIIERQIRKNKTRLGKKLRDGAFLKAMENDVDVREEEEFKIVRTKRHSIKPMSAEEAILQMNLLGHEFYLFRNAVTDETNLVYKRHDGNYGLIETED